MSGIRITWRGEELLAIEWGADAAMRQLAEAIGELAQAGRPAAGQSYRDGWSCIGTDIERDANPPDAQHEEPWYDDDDRQRRKGFGFG